jgi:aspartyl-tRNA(Asn)/glutamyl-tRNA(Gln) amidotransferase subunit C
VVPFDGQSPLVCFSIHQFLGGIASVRTIARHTRRDGNMSLTREDVKSVSLLARLELTDAEIELMTQQLGQILEYVEQLSVLDTEGVEPMAHTVHLTNVFAADVERPSLAREQALANAPKRDEECYRVPAVLGD